MNYTIKRLTTDKAAPASYHLFSESGNLLLVADAVTRGDSQPPQVRFARPDGTLLATMNLPARDAGSRPDYAIIQDFAVYAIITMEHRPGAAPGSVFHTYLTLEAEGGNWLVLPRQQPPGSFNVYGQMPDGLHTYKNLVESDLPEPIGHVYQAEEGDRDFLVELTTRRWRQTSLVVLALVYLLDHLQVREDGGKG